MGGDLYPETALRPRGRTFLMVASAFAFGLAGCNQAAKHRRRAPAATEKAAEAEEVEFPEFAVSPAELANHHVDDIVSRCV